MNKLTIEIKSGSYLFLLQLPVYVFYNEFWRRPTFDFPQSASIPQRHITPFSPFCDAALRGGQIITPVGSNCVINVGAVTRSCAACGVVGAAANLVFIGHRKREGCHYSWNANLFEHLCWQHITAQILGNAV